MQTGGGPLITCMGTEVRGQRIWSVWFYLFPKFLLQMILNDFSFRFHLSLHVSSEIPHSLCLSHLYHVRPHLSDCPDDLSFSPPLILSHLFHSLSPLVILSLCPLLYHLYLVLSLYPCLILFHLSLSLSHLCFSASPFSHIYTIPFVCITCILLVFQDVNKLLNSLILLCYCWLLVAGRSR